MTSSRGTLGDRGPRWLGVAPVRRGGRRRGDRDGVWICRVGDSGGGFGGEGPGLGL